MIADVCLITAVILMSIAAIVIGRLFKDEVQETFLIIASSVIFMLWVVWRLSLS